MYESLRVGTVIEVRGTRAKVLVEELNHSTIIFEGKVINNITVNSFIMIKKGFIDLVGKIDAEYIDDLINAKETLQKDHRYNKGSISRILEIQIVGYFEDNHFFSGVRHLPMIGNISYIPTSKMIHDIYAGNRNIYVDDSIQEKICLGKSIYEDIPVELPINEFFASHIGLFGNTGSGKSNTLTKLYYELFKTIGVDKIEPVSSFHIIDFNGEYAHNGAFGLPEDKVKMIEIGNEKADFNKVEVSEDYFKDSELLSILFNAKEQTQKPFLKRLLHGLENAESKNWTIQTWILSLYRKSLISSNKDIFEYFKTSLYSIASFIKLEIPQELIETWETIEWHSKYGCYYNKQAYFHSEKDVREKSNASGYEELGKTFQNMDCKINDWFTSLIINSKLRLVQDMLEKRAQFDHIHPLLIRMEANLNELKKSIKLVETEGKDPLVTIYSFRECSKDIKEMIPPMIATNLLKNHKKNTNQKNVNKSVHLIIDEAHNILKPQYESFGNEWHDYRLEVFEEIIKEGRKFGFFLTLASQRPSDISSTIISQVHNYFIHRLVNDKDLEMIDNTISTLDRVSKEAIPSLSSGSCIVTGNALTMSIFMQVDLIRERNARPQSDNLNLLKLWKGNN